jgi:hypothetical protein
MKSFRFVRNHQGKISVYHIGLRIGEIPWWFGGSRWFEGFGLSVPSNKWDASFFVLLTSAPVIFHVAKNFYTTPLLVLLDSKSLRRLSKKACCKRFYFGL